MRFNVNSTIGLEMMSKLYSACLSKDLILL